MKPNTGKNGVGNSPTGPVHPPRSGALAHPWTRLARVQGGFYFTTGMWPVVAPDSFQALTGRKADFWLVQSVGVLLAISGLVLLRAVQRAAVTTEIRLLAALQAVAFGIINVHCVSLPGTTRIYLIDAVVEFVFAAMRTRGWMRHAR